MAHTDTLRPDAAGDETSITSQYPTSGEHWDKVDEVVADEAATRVNMTGASYLRDLYNLPALSSGSQSATTIVSVVIYFRICPGGAVAGVSYATPSQKSGITVTDGTEIDVGDGADPNDYVTHSQTYTTNPATGVAYTWDEINALQIGVKIKNSNGYIYCTQVYAEVTYLNAYSVSASVSIGVLPAATKAVTFTRTSAVKAGIVAAGTNEFNTHQYLCVASKDSGSVMTQSRVGASWTTAARDASVALQGAYFTQYDNRLCVLRYQNAGFAYSSVNDIVSVWTDKPTFPNLPVVFTGMFASKDASDNSILYFLTQKGMFYLDVFTNFIFNPTEITWEEDSTTGKKGLYWKGDTYVAVGKGIYKIQGADVTLVGPDMDDGLPEDMQGTVTDMIGVGFWLVIAVDGGTSKKSSILKRYITGTHWHPVYVTSAVNSPIRALCWDAGTLYFGEGTNVKSLSFPTLTDNVNKLSTQTRAASGTLTYPYFHSVFETMPKVAHKVWATTKDCNANETITIHYRKDEETDWTLLGSFATSPRPTALSFGTAGVQFERIQLRASYARGSTTTNSPKVESLTLEYRVIPPTLWGWDVRIAASTSNDRRGQDIIDALQTAIETNTLLEFYPSGDKSKQVYYVQVKGMPGNEKGTEFGTEGIYLLSLCEVID